MKPRPRTRPPLVVLVGINWMLAKSAAEAIRQRLRCRTISFSTEHAFRVWQMKNSGRPIKCVVMALRFPWTVPAEKIPPIPPNYHESGGGKWAGGRVAALIPSSIRLTFFDTLSKGEFEECYSDYRPQVYVQYDGDFEPLLKFIAKG